VHPIVHPIVHLVHAQVARRGHRVEANDASSSMLVAAHALLSGAVARDALRFFPRVRCEAGALRRAPCLAASRAPDVTPALAHGGGNLTLQVGAFEQLYGTERHGAGAVQPWDALVTSYFIDTLADPAEAVRIAWDLLAPGGVWINVGPLHWHQPKLGFLRLRCALAMRMGCTWRTHGTRMAHIHMHMHMHMHMHSTYAQHTCIAHIHSTCIAHAWHTHGARNGICMVLCLLRCSWEELRGLLRLRGFTLREHRVIRRVPYLGRPARRARDELLSGVDSWHDAILFIAHKQG
jgi:hypothetical protein